MQPALSIVPTDDLRQLVDEVRALRAEVRGATITPAPQWHTRKEAARLTGYAPGYLPTLAKHGRIETNGKEGKACRYLVTPDMIVPD